MEQCVAHPILDVTHVGAHRGPWDLLEPPHRGLVSLGGSLGETFKEVCGGSHLVGESLLPPVVVEVLEGLLVALLFRIEGTVHALRRRTFIRIIIVDGTALPRRGVVYVPLAV
jgi:hypothetical protein